MNEFKKVTLANIAEGVAEELFQAELKKVNANINDPNTVSEAVRSITIKLDFRPNEEKKQAEVKVTVSSKLPGFRAASSFVVIGNNHGEKVMFQNVAKQEELFDNSNVVGMEKQGGQINA